MGIKIDPKTGLHNAFFSKRHPVTRQPVSLRRKGIKSAAEARRVERELIVEVEARIRAERGMRWQDGVREYLEAAKLAGLTINTLIGYECLLRTHTLSLWSDRDISAITSMEIRDLINEKMAAFSDSQRRNTLKVIRAVFNCAVETGKLQRNPTPQLHFKKSMKLKKVLVESEIRTLLNRAKELGSPWYPIWAMAVYTGMRSGELYALRWDKVNFETRQIIVDQSWNSLDGFKCTKSGNDRIVEIAHNLLHVLKELKLKSGDSPLVLPRLWQWDKGEQARELRKFLIGIGLHPVRFHDLRASWATVLLSRGVEPIKVMKAGGWTDMKTMMIYVRKAGVDIRGMSDQLDLHNPAQQSAQVISFPVA